MLEVAQDHEAVVCRVWRDRGAGSEEVRAVRELVVQVGRSVGDDTNCEIKTGDGFRGDVIGGWGKGSCSRYGVGGTKLATVKE
jgi:hypothetical protein